MFHVLAAIVATPLPTVVPSPTVIKETLQTVVQPVTPPVVIQAAQLASYVAGVAVIGLFHQLVERGKWSGQLNRILVALYSAGASVFAAFQAGQLHLDVAGGVTVAAAFLIALGTAMGRYELFNFVVGLWTSASKLAKPAQQALATDTTPTNDFTA